MKKSSRRKQTIIRYRSNKALISILVISVITTTLAISYLLRPTEVQAKEWDFNVKVEPIPEQEVEEANWSNFTSIYEEDLLTAKAEEAKMVAEAEAAKEAKVRLQSDLEHDELWYLAKGIHGEASICDRDEKYRVGTVIMNRVERSDYPNTVRGVISSGEYSCYQDSRWYSEQPSQEEWEIARDIYENGVRVFESNVVYQSKHAYGEIVFVSEWHEYGAKK